MCNMRSVYIWFSLGTPASSTTKTGRHEIDEILLKVALNTINQIKSNQIHYMQYIIINSLNDTIDK